MIYQAFKVKEGNCHTQIHLGIPCGFAYGHAHH
jgi:hypothetical protein